jgi:hypothetical protein
LRADEKVDTPLAMRVTNLVSSSVLLVGCLVPSVAPAWGPLGHALVVRAALQKSDALPAWFRDGGDQLSDLANAPDRWREDERDVPALAARKADHFFDLDVWGRERLPDDRWAYVRRTTQRGLSPDEIGFLPFAILEGYGVLLSAFRDVRASRPGAREGALAAAGVLAHLAGDAAVPLHLTRHHHGWKGPNPERYTRDPGVHRWFESRLVEGMKSEDVAHEVDGVRLPSEPTDAVRAMLADSLSLVPRLYQLERACRRDEDEKCRALARTRLAAGAALLIRLWETAWPRSGA